MANNIHDDYGDDDKDNDNNNNVCLLYILWLV